MLRSHLGTVGLASSARRLISAMVTGAASDGICSTQSPPLLVWGLHIHSLYAVKVGCAFNRKECMDSLGGSVQGVFECIFKEHVLTH